MDIQKIMEDYTFIIRSYCSSVSIVTGWSTGVCFPSNFLHHSVQMEAEVHLTSYIMEYGSSIESGEALRARRSPQVARLRMVKQFNTLPSPHTSSRDGA
jgi:hypothetical protein